MDITTLSFKYAGERLQIIDQTRLPNEEVWLEASSPQVLAAYIKSLKVRGAPLIGIAAGLCLGIFAKNTANWSAILTAGLALREARPTAVNLMNVIDELLSLKDGKKLLPQAIKLALEDKAMCENMGKLGADLIQPGEGIVHYCNTGELATAGIGTALGVIRTAHRQNKHIHVYVCETRPLLQGARLTAWELEKIACPYTLVCDNMVGALMQAGKINRCLVGADRIALNGDFANKIGTYSLAILARYHGVDFHPVAPVSTIDFNCASGKSIPIELRDPNEIKGFGGIDWAPKQSSATPKNADKISERENDAYNPAFDITPAELYTSLVLDSAVLPSKSIQDGQLTNLNPNARSILTQNRA